METPYRILLVEDEQLICESIKAKLSGLPAFTVCATAHNGLEALELVNQVNPHVIITDLMMPVMDGLTLIRKLRESNNNIPVVIISGYDTFSYAQTAIKYGVADYLLKPISKEDFFATLTELEEKLKADHNSQRETALLRTLQGYPLSEKEQNLLKDNTYHLCLINVGNLHPYSANTQPQAASFLIDSVQLRTVCNKAFPTHKTIYFMDAKAGNQKFILIPANSQQNSNSQPALLYQAMKELVSPIPVSLFVHNESITLDQLFSVSHTLQKECEKRIQIGMGNMFLSGKDFPPKDPIRMELVIPRFLHLLQQEDEGRFSSEFITYFEQMQSHPQHHIQDAFMSLLRSFHKHTPTSNSQMIGEVRERLLEVCAYETEYSKMVRSANACFQQFFPDSSHVSGLSTETIQAAVKYMEQHFREDISIEELSTRLHFNSTYFSRIFRKTLGISPSQYLSDLRISEAKRLLIRYPDYSVREVAEACGYNDPHYFSRLFKQTTGLNPTAFRESIQSGDPKDSP